MSRKKQVDLQMALIDLAVKMLNGLPAETAHRVAIDLLRVFSRLCNAPVSPSPSLGLETMGLKFAHPIGLAAGFDKHAEAFHALGRLGFAFVEVGSVTPKPQLGNPRPRLFRLTEDAAIINRYGFNSRGCGYVGRRLDETERTVPTGINLGANAGSQDFCGDFLDSYCRLSRYADFVTINISSPNTKGLRDLHRPDRLSRVLRGIRGCAREADVRPPLLVKLSPDLDRGQEREVFAVLLAEGVDGVIVANTTTSRPALVSVHGREPGGLSGRPLEGLALAMLERAFEAVGSRVPLIASGGVCDPEGVFRRLSAGATLVQIYTAFVYQGPGLLYRMLQYLADSLTVLNLARVEQITGSALTPPALDTSSKGGSL